MRVRVKVRVRVRVRIRVKVEVRVRFIVPSPGEDASDKITLDTALGLGNRVRGTGLGVVQGETRHLW